jgi:hypothetical protein
MNFDNKRTGCGSLVVVLSLSIWEVVSSSPARANRIKPMKFKIGGIHKLESSRYALKHRGPVSQ